jgi:hypothetical protein
VITVHADVKTSLETYGTSVWTTDHPILNKNRNFSQLIVLEKLCRNRFESFKHHTQISCHYLRYFEEEEEEE